MNEEKFLVKMQQVHDLMEDQRYEEAAPLLKKLMAQYDHGYHRVLAKWKSELYLWGYWNREFVNPEYVRKSDGKEKRLQPSRAEFEHSKFQKNSRTAAKMIFGILGMGILSILLFLITLIPICGLIISFALILISFMS